VAGEPLVAGVLPQSPGDSFTLSAFLTTFWALSVEPIKRCRRPPAYGFSPASCLKRNSRPRSRRLSEFLPYLVGTGWRRAASARITWEIPAWPHLCSRLEHAVYGGDTLPCRAVETVSRLETPQALTQPRYLFVVSRRHPELYELLVERFEGDRNVEVILDRRSGPSGEPGPATERRRALSSATDLTIRSHVIITRD